MRSEPGKATQQHVHQARCGQPAVSCALRARPDGIRAASDLSIKYRPGCRPCMQAADHHGTSLHNAPGAPDQPPSSAGPDSLLWPAAAAAAKAAGRAADQGGAAGRPRLWQGALHPARRGQPLARGPLRPLRCPPHAATCARQLHSVRRPPASCSSWAACTLQRAAQVPWSV